MKNSLNTLIRVVLCLALILAVVPTPVFAESVTISARAEGGGKIQIGDREPAVSDSVIVEKGSPSITIKAIPDDGYRLSY
ncbi:MAG: hypothetical protein IKR93_07955, partial [Firmicutes bacterium]|nr:hypothetical protein [Bacillota bacterium]